MAKSEQANIIRAAKKAHKQPKRRFTTSEQKQIEYLSRLFMRADMVAGPTRKKLSNRIQYPDKFIIASISHTLRKSDLIKWPKTSRHIQYTLYHQSSQVIKRIESEMYHSIRQACEFGAQYICANELSFPYWKDHPDHINLRRRLHRNLLNCSRKNDVYIFPGSYHCKDTLLNLVPIYYPKNNPRNNPLYHAKRTSAQSLGERILIPYSRFIRYYETKYGIVALLICLDCLDPSMILGLIRAQYDAKHNELPKADIIFVPSFSNQEQVAEAAMDLSYYLSNIVVLTNEASRGGTFYQNVFLCGNEIEGKEHPQNRNVNIYEIEKSEFDKCREIGFNKDKIFYDILGIKRSSIEINI